MSPCAVLLACMAANQLLTFGSSFWLSEWARDALQIGQGNPHHLPLAQEGGVWFYIVIYVSVSVTAALILLLRAVIQTFTSVNAARRVHTAAASAVLAAPMSFFDTTPLGRILNRFSGDVQKVDTQLASSGFSFVNLVASLIGTLSLLVLNSWWIVLTVPVLGVVYLRIAGFYRNSARELQRLGSVSKSPIYAAFSEALGGAATIQAYGRTHAFEAANMARFDRNLRAGFISAVANRWLSVRLELLSNILLTFTALAAIISALVSSSSGNGLAAGMAGLALAYAPGLTDQLSFLIRQFTTLETDMVSAERLFNFAQVRVGV